MGRPVCQAYIQRNVDIVQRYVGDPTVTIGSLAETYGLSRLWVRRILDDAGVEIRREPRKARIERRPKNNLLTSIGVRLQTERARRGKSNVEFALMLGLSEAKLSDAFQGLYDWKFSELLRVAEVLGISVDEFINPKRKEQK